MMYHFKCIFGGGEWRDYTFDDWEAAWNELNKLRPAYTRPAHIICFEFSPAEIEKVKSILWAPQLYNVVDGVVTGGLSRYYRRIIKREIERDDRF